MKNQLDVEQATFCKVVGSNQANQDELSARPQRPAAANVGAMLMLAGAAQAARQMPKLSPSELRLLAAYRKDEDCQRLFDSLVQMVNGLP